MQSLAGRGAAETEASVNPQIAAHLPMGCPQMVTLRELSGKKLECVLVNRRKMVSDFQDRLWVVVFHYIQDSKIQIQRPFHL